MLKALEKWHPGYIDWWNDLIPQNFQESLVYLRTAVSVDPEGLGQVRLCEDAGLPLGHPAGARRTRTGTIPFGEHDGEPAWQEVPGEHRAMLRRLIVIQGDTEPASRRAAAPSRRDRAHRSTTCATYSRSTSRRAATSGRWSTCCRSISAATAARRPRTCCAAARAATTRRACSAPSTRRRRTGCPSSCSPTSPTATARCSWRAWRSPASTRCRAPAASC